MYFSIGFLSTAGKEAEKETEEEKLPSDPEQIAQQLLGSTTETEVVAKPVSNKYPKVFLDVKLGIR